MAITSFGKVRRRIKALANPAAWVVNVAAARAVGVSESTRATAAAGEARALKLRHKFRRAAGRNLLIS